MEILKGSSVTFKAYFEDTNNDAWTGHNSDVYFVIHYDDGTYEDAAVSTRELGGGWYAYDFTEAEGQNGMWRAYDNTATVKSFAGGIFTIINIEEKSGTKTLETNTNEQTIFEETISSGISVIEGIWIDLYSLTQNATIRVCTKVDGTNYRKTAHSWKTTDSKLFFIPSFYCSNDVKITIQSAYSETATRSIPYLYYLKVL